MIILYKKFTGVKITEAERMEVARGWGRKEWVGRYLMDLMGRGFNFTRRKELSLYNSFTDDGDGCILWMYLILLNCASKNGWNGKFYAVFYHNKIIKPDWFILDKH